MLLVEEHETLELLEPEVGEGVIVECIAAAAAAAAGGQGGG